MCFLLFDDFKKIWSFIVTIENKSSNKLYTVDRYISMDQDEEDIINIDNISALGLNKKYVDENNVFGKHPDVLKRFIKSVLSMNIEE